jgi:hypothetical protein
MIGKRFRPRERRPRIKRSPLESRLAELRAATLRVRASAQLLTEMPMTAHDRKRFEELVELVSEIRDFARRLRNSPREKWRIGT